MLFSISYLKLIHLEAYMYVNNLPDDNIYVILWKQMLGGDHPFITVYQPFNATSPKIETGIRRVTTIKEATSFLCTRNIVLYHG